MAPWLTGAFDAAALAVLVWTIAELGFGASRARGAAAAVGALLLSRPDIARRETGVLPDAL